MMCCARLHHTARNESIIYFILPSPTLLYYIIPCYSIRTSLHCATLRYYNLYHVLLNFIVLHTHVYTIYIYTYKDVISAYVFTYVYYIDSWTLATRDLKVKNCNSSHKGKCVVSGSLSRHGFWDPGHHKRPQIEKLL